MFDFFDKTQNPFMSMMDMDPEDAQDMEQFGFEGFADPMMFMQQMFMMQMQFAQTMFMMPLRMMKAMTEMMGQTVPDDSDESGEGQAKGQTQGGIKLGGLDVPPELLQKLMNMDMSPENLEKLQKVLDFVFSAVPDKKEGSKDRENADE